MTRNELLKSVDFINSMLYMATINIGNIKKIKKEKMVKVIERFEDQYTLNILKRSKESNMSLSSTLDTYLDRAEIEKLYKSLKLELSFLIKYEHELLKALEV